MWIFMTILFAVLVFFVSPIEIVFLGRSMTQMFWRSMIEVCPCPLYMLQTPVEANPFGGHFAKGESPI